MRLKMAMNDHPGKDVVATRRVLVVGDVMLDRYWFGAVERISPEAPVPVLHVQREQDRVGGAANVALNVKTLGGQVTLLSMVGQDEPAQRLTQLLREQGVAPGAITTSRPESTNGRRSTCRGAMPLSTKVGQADRASVGCAMYRAGSATMRSRKAAISAREARGPMSMP